MMKVNGNRKGLAPVLWGTALGVVVGGISFYVAMNTSNAALQLTFAEVLFPYFIMVDPTVSYPSTILIAVILWPLYGAVAGFLWRMRERKFLLIGSLLILLVLHVLSVAEAKHRRDAFYGPKITGEGTFIL